MSKTMLRIVSLILAVIMLAALCISAVSCGNKNNGEGADYTYKSYTTALGTNWNPHTWETNADDSILSYVSSPFVTMEAKDTENGVYQWVYEMATSITDVTADHTDDLTKYGCSLPEGTAAADVKSGYVFEIALNPDAMWQNGEKITADDYIYSMKQLLDSKMKNYRANLYISGESAVAGGQAYYDSESPIYAPVVAPYAEEGDYSFDVDAALANGTLYVNVGTDQMTLYNMSLSALNSSYLGDETIAALFTRLANEANAYGYTKVTAENKEEIFGAISTILEKVFGIGDAAARDLYVMEALFYNTGEFGAKVEYDKVGCYKVDDYTIRYVCQTAIDYYYFLTSCTSTWLVYEELYEAGKDTTGELVTTNYGTSADTTMSYGVYKLDSLQPGKQIVFVQNENWYGFEKNEDGTAKRDEEGNLISYTSYHKNIDGEEFKVDGEAHRQHVIEKVVIDVMEEATAKAAFLKGELSDWSTPAAEVPTYAASDRLYKVDETYTMSFFFNTGLDALKNMDANEGNKNSVVLSNTNFRKGFSYAIDRAKYVTATEGYKPAFALLNSLYYYDFYNDPSSSYRNTDQAKEAICNLYGVKWGEGTPYATLDEAVDSVTGYNLEEAKKLLKTACEELVAEGLYTAGEAIEIKIGWAKGALTEADNKQATLMNEFINAAAEGSGFGTITFTPIGNIDDRYGDVPAGKYAIGYGAWGGAALYPFRNFQVYMDPDNTPINEAGCWDPKTEELTLTVNGEEVTMTWQAWSNCMIGTGKYAEADFETKLDILSMLETKYLERYYRIPLAGTTICSMLSYQLDYYTQEYNFAYGFGGSRLMKFNYNDAEWAAYVAEQGGTLSYE